MKSFALLLNMFRFYFHYKDGFLFVLLFLFLRLKVKNLFLMAQVGVERKKSDSHKYRNIANGQHTQIPSTEILSKLQFR